MRRGFGAYLDPATGLPTAQPTQAWINQYAGGVGKPSDWPADASLIPPPNPPVSIGMQPQVATLPRMPLQIAPVAVLQPVGAPSPTVMSTAAASPSLLSTTFLGLPLWLWGAGAVGAYFAFGGGHAR